MLALSVTLESGPASCLPAFVETFADHGAEILEQRKEHETLELSTGQSWCELWSKIASYASLLRKESRVARLRQSTYKPGIRETQFRFGKDCSSAVVKAN
jgi:hypothetical protein